MPEDQQPRDAQEALDVMRERIMALDEELVALIGRRRDLVLEIGRMKGELGLPVLDPRREAAVVKRAAQLSRELGVDEELTRDVIWRIISSAREAQRGEGSWGPPAPPGEASTSDD